MSKTPPEPGPPRRPRVHVVLAAHEPDDRHLKTQLESILAQRDVEVSVRIVDDGSSEGARTRLEQLTTDPRVRVEHGPRLGVFHNFERGLRLAPRDVDAILLSDQDDVWLPDKALTLFQKLCESDDILLVHSDARVVDDTGAVLAASLFEAEGRDVEHLDVDHLILKNVVTGCTAALSPKLLSVALPFPHLGDRAPFHHDLWLALCAASTGRIGTVRQVLGDYRQHGGNVVGLEPLRNRWKEPRRALADWRLRRLVALSVDDAVQRGQLPASGPASDAARWLGRAGAFHALGLARRWHRQGDPQADFALLLGFVGLVSQLRVPRGRLASRARRARRLAPLVVRGAARVARDPALRARLLDRLDVQVFSPRLGEDLGNALPHALRPLPASLIAADGRRTLHVLVPYIPAHGVFGGVATAMRLAVELAHQGEDVQVIETDRTDELDMSQMRASLRRSLGVPDDWVANIRFASGVSPNTPLRIRPDDIFVATAWWTAQRAHWTAHALGLRNERFVYLIQDYEPSFYAGSDEQALAEWSYRMPCWPVVNAATLAAYVRRETNVTVDEDLVLAPQVDVASLVALPRAANHAGPLRVLLYGRPGVPRNLFETAVRGLAAWVAVREEGRRVEVCSAGETHADLNLSHGVSIRSLGQLSWDGYVSELARSDIGLSLMLSPHPSYPPLEMAAAGLTVVTNRYAGKDLEVLSPRFVSCEPTSLDVARALAVAESRHAELGDEGRFLDLDQLGRPMDKVVTALRERFDH